MHTNTPAHNTHTRIGNNRQSKTSTNTQSLITRHKAGMDDCRQMHGNLFFFFLFFFGKFASSYDEVIAKQDLILKNS